MLTARERNLISNVLERLPDGIEQQLALGSLCPFDAMNRKGRAEWIEEINRQRADRLAAAT